MEKPFADHPGCRFLAGQPYRDPGAPRGRSIVDRLPPCNNACPAGENIQAWLYHAETGDYEAAWRELMENNPMPAVMGRVCYHPCETSCNRGQLDEAVNIHAVERFLGDEASKRGWKIDDRAGHRQASPGGRRGPVRPVRRLSSALAGPRGDDLRSRAADRRHDALRHSEIPVAARYPRCRNRAHRRHGRRPSSSTARSTTCWRRMKEGGFDAVFLAVGAHHRQARVHSCRRRRQDTRRGIGLARHGRARTGPCSDGAWWSTAAATPPSMSPAPPSAWARKSRSSSIAAPARRCPRTISKSRKRWKKACMIKWLSTIKAGVEAELHGGEDGAGRQGLSAADRRIRDHRGRLPGAGVGPGCRSLAAPQRAGLELRRMGW